MIHKLWAKLKMKIFNSLKKFSELEIDSVNHSSIRAEIRTFISAWLDFWKSRFHTPKIENQKRIAETKKLQAETVNTELESQIKRVQFIFECERLHNALQDEKNAPSSDQMPG